MSLVLQSSGGGQITIQEPTTASNFTQTLPASTGTVVLTDVAGTVALAATGSNIITASTNSVERMRITSAGNVGIGTNNPGAKLHVVGTILSADGTNGRISLETLSTQNFLASGNADFSSWKTLAIGSSSTVFNINGAEAMRIDSSNQLIVGKPSSSIGVMGIYFTPTGVSIASVTTGTNAYQLYSTSSSSYRFYVNENGGIYNFSGNNVNLSDERTKTNIEVAGSYLDKICSIPVKLFNYKDESEGEQRTLGVIAQDVEAVAPEFVSNDGWEGTEPEDGVPLKTIYSTDMMFGMMKAIQEQQELIKQLQATVDLLSTEVAALKGTV
jgi:hypothetical protein